MNTTLTPAGKVTMAKGLPPPWGKRLQGLREAAGLSQQELAFRAGLSVSVVCQIEQGRKKDPKLSTLVALALALDRTIGELTMELTREEKEPRKRKEK
jgi:transcriptional regulator with XRE-family HTH domain